MAELPENIHVIQADINNVEEVAAKIKDLLFDCVCDWDFEGSLIGDKANCVVFDNKKLKALVPDFVCTTRVDQGIHKVVENCLKHPELQEEDPEFDQFCDRVIAAMEQAKKAVIG